MTSHASCLCLSNHTHCIDDITHTLFMTSPLLYIWHNMHCISHLTHDLWHCNSLFMTSKLLNLTSHRLYLKADPLYLFHHTQIIDHTTPLYVRYHSHNMYDIIWTTYDITSTLYDITPRYDITPTLFMSSNPGYLSSHALFLDDSL